MRPWAVGQRLSIIVDGTADVPCRHFTIDCMGCSVRLIPSPHLGQIVTDALILWVVVESSELVAE